MLMNKNKLFEALDAQFANPYTFIKEETFKSIDGQEFLFSGEVSGNEGYEPDNYEYVTNKYKAYVLFEKENDKWSWSTSVIVDSFYDWDMNGYQNGFDNLDDCINSFKKYVEENFDTFNLEGIA